MDSTARQTFTAPDLINALEPGRHPLAPLELADYDAALLAIVDREDVAGFDERARLGRVRAYLEAHAAELLAQ